MRTVKGGVSRRRGYSRPWPGIGRVTAARLLDAHGPIEGFPEDVLNGERRERALLFKTLATLRTDADLFESVDRLEWLEPTPGFAEWSERTGDRRLLERAEAAARASHPDRTLRATARVAGSPDGGTEEEADGAGPGP